MPANPLKTTGRGKPAEAEVDEATETTEADEATAEKERPSVDKGVTEWAFICEGAPHNRINVSKKIDSELHGRIERTIGTVKFHPDFHDNDHPTPGVYFGPGYFYVNSEMESGEEIGEYLVGLVERVERDGIEAPHTIRQLTTKADIAKARNVWSKVEERFRHKDL